MRRRTLITRRGFVCAAGALAASPSSGRATQRAPMARRIAWGINLAGAEFGDLPGQHGTAYLYPTPENFAYAARKGFSLVRLPFKWERLEPRLGEPFDVQELSLLRQAVATGTQHGMTVVLDPHNYAKRRLATDGWTREHEIGSASVPTASFARFWHMLATEFGNAPQVHFGLMNEPVSQKPDTWRGMAQEAIDAIRGTGAKNQIYVPGTAYSGAHSWSRVGNRVMGALKDPAQAMAFEVHQYFDANSSGTRPEVVSRSIGSERLTDFQRWAKDTGVRAFLGEFGAARDARSLAALADMLDEVAANPDVWIGTAAWAGGPRWPPEEMFNLEPWPDGAEKPQMAVLSGFARGAPPVPVFKGEMAAVSYDVRREGQGAAGMAASALADVMRGDRFTLVIELPEATLLRPQDLVKTDAGLVVASAPGHVRSDLAEGLRAGFAGPVSAGSPRRVRIALAVDRAAGTVALCATGGKPGQAPLAAGRVLVDAQTLHLAPQLLRLAAYTQAFAVPDLAELVA